jgi:hypothetical protein
MTDQIRRIELQGNAPEGEVSPCMFRLLDDGRLSIHIDNPTNATDWGERVLSAAEVAQLRQFIADAPGGGGIGG